MNDAERRKELADFLRTRRGRLSPTNVGLPPGVRRKTTGLRREEVAQLASVGVTWYTWLEQGRDIHVSSQILESLAQVLLMNADEKAHLFSLANQPLVPPPPIQQEMVSPLLRRFLDQLGPSPAYITGRRWDLLAWNQAACQVLGNFSAQPPEHRNIVWFVFTNQEFRRRAMDWEGIAQRVLAQFRASSGRTPGDPWFTTLIEALKEASPEFRLWWPRHEVKGRQDGRKEIIHPSVGHLVFETTTLQVSETSNLQIGVYLTSPESAKKIQELLSREQVNV